LRGAQEAGAVKATTVVRVPSGYLVFPVAILLSIPVAVIAINL